MSNTPLFEEEIVIGKVNKSFGIKGFLKVEPLTDYIDRFLSLEKIHLYSEKKKSFFENSIGNTWFGIEDAEITQNFVKLKIEGIDDRNNSDLLRDYLITIPIKDRIKRDEGEHYYYELIDCDVYSNNDLIGKVKAIENYGSDDLLKIETDTKEEVFIPYRDEFIIKIDTEGKRIDVKLIEGLID